MTELRPPAKWAHLQWHWLRNTTGHLFVAMWQTDEWWCCGCPEPLGSDLKGVEYARPCDPAVLVPDPTDERQVEAVARAIVTLYGHNPDGRCYDISGPHHPLWQAYMDEARAALRALAEMKETKDG